MDDLWIDQMMPGSFFPTQARWSQTLPAKYPGKSSTYVTPTAATEACFIRLISIWINLLSHVKLCFGFRTLQPKEDGSCLPMFWLSVQSSAQKIPAPESGRRSLQTVEFIVRSKGGTFLSSLDFEIGSPWKFLFGPSMFSSS